MAYQPMKAGNATAISTGLAGGLAFRLHRFTGLALSAYLFLHVLWIFAAVAFPGLIRRLTGVQAPAAARLVEVLIVFCACFHGLNGLRISLLDLVLPQRWVIISARRSFHVVLLISVLLWVLVSTWLLARLPSGTGGG